MPTRRLTPRFALTCTGISLALSVAGCSSSSNSESGSGGAPSASGGAHPSAGGTTSATGGSNTASGGTQTSGGTQANGGAQIGSGGASNSAGASGSNSAGSGAAAGAGGKVASGGSVGIGGSLGSGGRADPSSGGSAGSNGGNTQGAGGAATQGPCDIYAAGNTPCVAAHSTVRALFGAYAGKLYQVRRASDKTTQDIGVLAPGGYAASATQDSFCTGTTCTISIIYDQTTNGNDLTKAPAGGWLNNGGLEANATAAKIMAGGHSVYGVYTTSNFDNNVGAVGYRNNKTKGVAVGDEPESMYMVVSGKHYNQWCCFDYGNAETDNKDDGPATMEAVYFGNSTQWGRGSGNGPWVMADLEDGVFAGGSTAAPASNTSIVANFVTAMLKGPSGNRFALKAGDAESGKLATKYDGTRPSGYSPQKKQGAIILGIGGDNSHTGEGTFFEGCMTTGVPADSVDDAVQANIVAAGYGH